VTGSHALGELVHELLPGEGGVERRKTTDELDDLDVASGKPINGTHDRLQRPAPRERHHLIVPQCLVQPARGQAAHAGQNVGLRGDLQNADVDEPEPIPQGQLDPIDRFEQEVRKAETLSETEVQELRDQARDAVRDAVRTGQTGPPPSTDLLAAVYAPSEVDARTIAGDGAPATPSPGPSAAGPVAAAAGTRGEAGAP